MERKSVKIGVHRGGGAPPGYLWNVWMIDFVHDEAMGFLNDAQYKHLEIQVQDLALEIDPTHSKTQSVDAVEDFHELRDRAGILGGMNVRVFFHLDKDRQAIVILGAIQKQNNGPTPFGDKIRMRRRKRAYCSGQYGYAI